MKGTTHSPGRLRVHQLVRALVRAAGGEDAGDAVAAEYLQHLVERIERIGFLVVVQMRVENLKLSRRLFSGSAAAPLDPIATATTNI